MPQSGKPNAAYTDVDLSRALIWIANGTVYSERALRQAREDHANGPSEHELLERYARGEQTATDHVALQHLANRIAATARHADSHQGAAGAEPSTAASTVQRLLDPDAVVGERYLGNRVLMRVERLLQLAPMEGILPDAAAELRRLIMKQRETMQQVLLLRAQLEEARDVAQTLYKALDDAASVVDAGEGEDYAYQAELESGASLLGIARGRTETSQSANTGASAAMPAPTCALDDPAYRAQTQALKDVSSAINGTPSSPAVFSTDVGSVLSQSDRGGAERVDPMDHKVSYLVAVIGPTKAVLAQCFATTQDQANRAVEAMFHDLYGEQGAGQCIDSQAVVGTWIEGDPSYVRGVVEIRRGTRAGPELPGDLMKTVNEAAERLKVWTLTDEQLAAELARAQTHDPNTGYYQDCAAAVALGEEHAARRVAAGLRAEMAMAISDSAELEGRDGDAGNRDQTAQQSERPRG